MKLNLGKTENYRLTIEESDVDTDITDFVCQSFSSVEIVATNVLQITASEDEIIRDDLEDR